MRYENKEKTNLEFLSGQAPKFDGNTFSVRTEPGAQALKLPEPIPLLGNLNKYVDVKYEGGMNIADNTVEVAALDYNGPEWKKFDAVEMQIVFNYLGLGMTSSDHNNAYNVQFRITQQDAISAAYASQLTELEFMALLCQSSIPELEGYNVDEGKWTGSARFAFLIWYQVIMQNAASVLGKYHTLMSYADYLVKMGYNAEAHMTMRLINILKKQNVWTLFQQFGNLLQSGFFDLDFYNEITSLNTIMCRKYEEVGSPILTINGVIKVPDVAILDPSTDQMDVVNFKFKDATDEQIQSWLLSDSFVPPRVFTYRRTRAGTSSQHVYEAIANAIALDPDHGLTQDKKDAAIRNGKIVDALVSNYANIEVEGLPSGEGHGDGTMSVQQLFRYVQSLLSPVSILKWAREHTFIGDTPADPGYGYQDDPAKAYANRLINAMIALVGMISHFRTDTSDLVTFLRVLQNSTTLNTWVMDTPYTHPAAPKPQADPVYFKLIYDLLTSTGVSGNMELDDNTKGWKVYTWWHATEGIPKYDAYDGGLTMAVSIRGVPPASSGDYTGPEYVLPVLFNVAGTRMLNRKGKEMVLEEETYTRSDIQGSQVFAPAELMSLPETMKLPKLDFTNKTGFDNQDYGQAVRLLSLLFGIGVVVTTSGETEFMDPKLEGVIGREFTNCNSRSIEYINTRAPFRTTNGKGSLGFTR